MKKELLTFLIGIILITVGFNTTNFFPLNVIFHVAGGIMCGIAIANILKV